MATIQIESRLNKNLREVSKRTGIKRKELVDRALILYFKSIQNVFKPRKELYARDVFSDGEEALISPREFRTFKPTKIEIMALKRARENYKKGNYMTLEEFERKLGFKN